jgi:succinate dehydrogenase / fumarate reductase flavoprotein subunit
VAGYLAANPLPKVTTDHDAFAEAEASVRARTDKLLAVKGHRTAKEIHRELGRILWEFVGMSRNAAGLETALRRIPDLREQFWQTVSVPGQEKDINQALEYAGRVADYLEFAELLARDALERRESCGGHFREESQTPDNEALRDDEHFAHAAAWEYTGDGRPPVRHVETLEFEYAKPSQRSYK